MQQKGLPSGVYEYLVICRYVSQLGVKWADYEFAETDGHVCQE